MSTAHHARQTGYTLIEMMIVLAIVGIIAAVAFPSYRGYVERTQRTVAKTAISEILSRQESYAVDHKRYTGDFARLGYPGTGTSTTAYVNSRGDISLNATGALYRLELKGNSGTIASCSGLGATPSAFAYAVLATPADTKVDRRCGALCMTSTGERGAAGGAETCWQR